MDAFFAAIGLADAGLFVRAVVAFLICLALLALVFLLLGWISGRSPLPGARNSARARLGVVEETNVDGKRRLVLVRRDNAEHLILTGGPNDLLIEGPILRGPARPGQTSRAPLAAKTDRRSADAAPAAAASEHPAARTPEAQASAPEKSASPMTGSSVTAPSMAAVAAVGATIAGTVAAARSEAAEIESDASDARTSARSMQEAGAGDADDVPSPARPPIRELDQDAALADAFARDFEADFTLEDPKIEALSEGASGPVDETRNALDADPAPSGAIPSTSANVLEEARDEPSMRGRAPFEDEPTPELPRFLRARPEDEGAPTPPPNLPRPASPFDAASKSAPSSDDADEDADGIDAPDAGPGAPHEPAREIPADETRAEEIRADETPVEEVVVAEPPRATRPFEALYRSRSELTGPAEILPTRRAPSETASSEAPQAVESDPARDDGDASGTEAPGEMQSLEEQMENLLRELTERGKPAPGKPGGGEGS